MCVFGIFPAWWVCGFVSVINFGKFLAMITSKYFFWFILSFIFSFLYSNCAYVTSFEVVSQSWMSVLFYPPFFSLHFSLGNFYWSIFMFFDSFLGSVKCTDELLEGFLYFHYTVFISKISFWLFLRVSISLLTLLICFLCCLHFPLEPYALIILNSVW